MKYCYWLVISIAAATENRVHFNSEPSVRVFQKHEASALYYDTLECIRTPEQWEEFNELSDRIDQRECSQDCFLGKVFNFFCINDHHEDVISEQTNATAIQPHSILSQPKLRTSQDDEKLSVELIAEIRKRSILNRYLGEYFQFSKYITQNDDRITMTKMKALRYLSLCLKHQRLYHANCSTDIIQKARNLIGLGKPGSYGSRTGFQSVKT